VTVSGIGAEVTHRIRDVAAGSVSAQRRSHVRRPSQEYAHILRRRGLSGADVRDQARDVAALCLLHDVTEEDLRLAMNLGATHPVLRVRDAVHVATALRRGISVILSADRDFDGIPGLERLDPHDAVQRLVPGPLEAN
jgi:predicted nucleic acid-binding protein